MKKNMKQFGLICLIFTVIVYAPVIQNVSADRIQIESWRINPENAGVNITDDGTYILTSDIYDDILITNSNMKNVWESHFTPCRAGSLTQLLRTTG